MLPVVTGSRRWDGSGHLSQPVGVCSKLAPFVGPVAFPALVASLHLRPRAVAAIAIFLADANATHLGRRLAPCPTTPWNLSHPNPCSSEGEINVFFLSFNSFHSSPSRITYGPSTYSLT